MADIFQPKSANATPDLTERAFAEFGPELQRFLTRRVRCAHTARDLAQDTYLRFMLVSRQEGIRNARAFLYQLATHVAHEYRLRQQHSQVVYDSDLVDAADRKAAAETGGDASDRLSVAEELTRALQPLPKAYRAVLLMRKR